MSQYPTQPRAAYAPESNTLGVAGFVCSLIGLVVTGGLLCPIGLIISLIAVGRQPKGFAIAGIILGLVGSCSMLLAVLFFGVVILTAVGAVFGLGIAAFILSEPEKLEVTADMANIAAAVEIYKDENRLPPADLEILDLDAAWRTDPWGNAYAYHLQEDPPGYDLESAGPDGKVGTPDDIRLSTLDDVWAAQRFNVSVEESDDGGSVRITLGDRELIRASGTDDEGTVRINLGDRVLEIVGDDEGGTVQVVPPAPDSD